MAWGDPGSGKRAWERAKSGGVSGFLVGGAPGAMAGLAAGALGWGEAARRDRLAAGTDITATTEQTAAFERQNQLRQEAIMQARGMGDDVARDVSQKGALAYGRAGEVPKGGGILAGLRDVDVGAGAARRTAALQGTIFEQEASGAAAERKNIAWLTQQIESMRAAGRLTPQAIEGLIPMAESEAAIAFLNDQRDRSPAESSLIGDVGNVASYVLGNPLDRR